MGKPEISIIIPVYYGNHFLDKLISLIQQNSDDKIKVQVIFVNDSPDVEIQYTATPPKNITIDIVTNAQNCGIHQSRINGLSAAHGEYIIFLDQDDIIMNKAITSQYQIAKKHNSDLVIGNGYIQDEDQKSHLLYSSRSTLKRLTHETPYILARNLIVSPGQCIIKKSAIPADWKQYTLSVNGADDFMLWLLLFNSKSIINTNHTPIYEHVYTGQNYSDDENRIYNSLQDMLQKLKHSKYPLKKIRKLDRSTYFKHTYKHTFIKSVLRSPIIFVYNVYFRLIWHGYVYKSNFNSKRS